MRYRIVREEVMPDVFTYIPEFEVLWWWERFVTGPFGCDIVSFANESAARIFIENEKTPPQAPKKTVVWRD